MSERLNSKKFFSIIVAICFVQVIASLSISAQVATQEEPPPDVAPPPLRLISKDEQKMLDSENDVKKRVKVSLGLMDARLLKAEKLNTEESFRESLNELAGFQAILDNTLKFLIQRDTGSDKIDKRFIDFEIYLRKQIPRLEIIRREMPEKFAYYVARIMKDVREARAKAVEPLFSDTVVSEKKKNEN